MDPQSIVFLVLMVLMGGVIAYLADRLGRTLGKKRLSFFKLRPRHTAELFTVLAGALIPLATILVVMVASSDVRRWMVEGRQAIHRADELKKANDALDKEIENKTKQVEGLGQRAQQLTTDLKSSEAKLKNSRAEVLELNGKIASLTSRIANVTNQFRAIQTRLKAAQKQYEEVSAARDLALNERNNAMRDFRTARTDRDEAYKELDKINRQLADVRRQVDSLTQTKTDLESNVKQLQDKIKQLNDDSEAQSLTFQRNLSFLKIQLEQRQEDLRQADERLQSVTKMLEQQVGAARTKPMIFRFGEELARLQVTPELSGVDARNKLSSLMRSARTLAASRGGKGRNTNDPAAGLWIREVNGVQVSIEEQEQTIIRRLTGVKDPLVLIASSSLNAFEGEFVSLEIVAYRNPVVFKEGETIADARIDGRLPEEAIVRQVSDFLMTKVREKAKSVGMIPVIGVEESYGSLSTDELLALVRLIKVQDRQIRLVAVAESETRAGDSLKLEFKIR